MDVGTMLRPPDPAFGASLAALWGERPDLQEAYSDPEGPGLVRWAATSGVLEYPERLGRFWPPVPPLEYRRTACGGATEQSHLWTATEDLEALRSLWDWLGGRPWTSIGSVLDFGCGCGRVLRWFPTALPGARVTGCDVRRASIDWCAANLEGDYHATGTRPPLPFADDSFDLVYALSVFSHLNRASNLAWLRELARVCRPDGRLLLTTFGPFAVWVLGHSAEHREAFRVAPAQVPDYMARLQAEGFLFHALPAERIRSMDGVERDYGQTFLTADFVAEEWASHVEVVGHVPASLSLLQDFWVLRPR
ncbi:MAG: class I SAM-dependent methyltransferase [Planctomycetota bacterium]